MYMLYVHWVYIYMCKYTCICNVIHIHYNVLYMYEHVHMYVCICVYRIVCPFVVCLLYTTCSSSQFPSNCSCKQHLFVNLFLPWNCVAIILYCKVLEADSQG